MNLFDVVRPKPEPLTARPKPEPLTAINLYKMGAGSPAQDWVGISRIVMKQPLYMQLNSPETKPLIHQCCKSEWGVLTLINVLYMKYCSCPMMHHSPARTIKCHDICSGSDAYCVITYVLHSAEFHYN